MTDDLTIWGETHILEVARTAPHLVREVLVDDNPRRQADFLGELSKLKIPVRAGQRLDLQRMAGEEARFPLALLKPFPYVGLEEMLRTKPPAVVAAASAAVSPASADSPSPPGPRTPDPRPRLFLVALDEVTDPGNLGAIIRTVRFFGGAGLILPEHRSAAVTSAVLRRSAGAAFQLPVARVTNLTRCLEQLKEAGFWIYGTGLGGKRTIWEEKYPEKSCFVLGSEGKGMRPTVAGACDEILSLPGQFESLNVAAFSSVLLYEWSRQIPSAASPSSPQKKP
jgi:tRNA G18 (ribose-2'-O)-methylase SpoU